MMTMGVSRTKRVGGPESARYVVSHHPKSEGPMEIEYLDRGARDAATPPGVRPPDWSHAEVSRLRLVVQCIRAARIPSDVLSLRCLRLRTDRDDPGRVRAELSSDRALTLAFKADSSPITAMLDIAPTRTDSGR